MQISARRLIFIGVLVAAAPALSACVASAPGGNGSVERATIDGVEVVTNQGAGRFAEPLFQLEPTLELAQDPASEESLLYRVADFARGADGNYYVADAGNARVAVFDAEGRYVRSFGRPGQGPGELGSTFRLVGPLEDEVQVFDVRAQRTLRFASDGTFLDTVALATTGRLDSLVHDPDGTRVATRDRTERQENLTLSGGVLEVYPPGVEEASVEVATDPTPSWVLTTVEIGDGGVATTVVQIPFAGTNQVLRGEGSIVAVDGEHGEVAWHDASGLTYRRSVLAEPRVPVTAEMRAAFEERFRRQLEDLAKEGQSFVAPVPELWYPELAGVWRDARLDDTGHLWLRDAVHASMRDEGDPHRFWVMAPDGALLGQVEMPASEFRIADGSLLVIQDDEATGEPRLRVFRLRPRPAGFSYP